MLIFRGVVAAKVRFTPVLFMTIRLDGFDSAILFVSFTISVALSRNIAGIRVVLVVEVVVVLVVVVVVVLVDVVVVVEVDVVGGTHEIPTHE